MCFHTWLLDVMFELSKWLKMPFISFLSLCCSTVLPDTSRKSRQKTRVVKKTANPMFNHTMVYDGFRPEDLREVCVELTVWDHDRLNNHYIGGVRLGLGTGNASLLPFSTCPTPNVWMFFLIYMLYLYISVSLFTPKHILLSV